MPGNLHNTINKIKITTPQRLSCHEVILLASLYTKLQDAKNQAQDQGFQYIILSTHQDYIDTYKAHSVNTIT